MIAYPLLSQTGRLGNQLWEIASTYGIARAAGTEPRFPKWDYRTFFNVPDRWFTGPLDDCVDAVTLAPHLDQRARAYLQDYGLFAVVASSVQSYLQPSVAAVRRLNDLWAPFADLPQPLLSVHVRRGDNVTHPQGYHPLRSMQYYRDALELVPGDGSLVVFSDDPEWCREVFAAGIDRKIALIYEGTPRPREYVDRQKYIDAPILDWIDLQLMARCDRHILSNSTYAWWGAFLSGDDAPIYPLNWFGWRVSSYTDASRMFPPSWRPVADATEGGVTC